ncbi:chondrolectin isoform X1 [Anguilla rostrata]|uniref:chondrolectin isoform X1 n=1 Tax=Anguilla rostrata TaxID=7938 RepID=UPI0030CE9F91
MRMDPSILPVLCGVMVMVSSCLGARVVSGQTICQGGPENPCYKIAYFRDVSSRVAFREARQVCEMDGGALLSVESPAEQQLIERLLQELSSSSSSNPAHSEPGIADGDFWIGLTRDGEPQDQGGFASCPDLYRWADNSVSQFRNWYYDEPSCGGEACVVMYHQPTALHGLGGPYLYQWNDDRCNMKHNFICKYAPESLLDKEFSDRPREPVYERWIKEEEREDKRGGWLIIFVDVSPKQPEESDPSVTNEEGASHVLVVGPSGLLLVYVIIPTIPLLLLIVVASGTCCFQMLSKSKPRTKTSMNQSTLWISKTPKADNGMEV